MPVNLLEYLDPQESWGQTAHAQTVDTRPPFTEAWIRGYQAGSLGLGVGIVVSYHSSHDWSQPLHSPYNYGRSIVRKQTIAKALEP